MRLFLRLLSVLILLAVAAFGVLFAFNNELPVAIDFIFFSLPELPLALWLFVAFALGGVLGVAVSMWGLVKLNARRARLERQLKQREQELNKLRAASLKS